jgi:hypothetical protein
MITSWFASKPLEADCSARIPDKHALFGNTPFVNSIPPLTSLQNSIIIILFDTLENHRTGLRGEQ